MKPIKFPGQNVILGENQPEYEPLPALVVPNDERGTIITCWELTDAEIELLVKTKRFYLSQYTFNSPLQPILLVVELSDLVDLKYDNPPKDDNEDKRTENLR